MALIRTGYANGIYFLFWHSLASNLNHPRIYRRNSVQDILPNQGISHWQTISIAPIPKRCYLYSFSLYILLYAGAGIDNLEFLCIGFWIDTGFIIIWRPQSTSVMEKLRALFRFLLQSWFVIIQFNRNETHFLVIGRYFGSHFSRCYPVCLFLWKY